MRKGNNLSLLCVPSSLIIPHLPRFLLLTKLNKTHPVLAMQPQHLCHGWKWINNFVFFSIWLCNKQHIFYVLCAIAYNCIFTKIGKLTVNFKIPYHADKAFKPLCFIVRVFMEVYWNIFSSTKRADAFGMNQSFIMQQMRNANVSLLILLLLPWK